MRREDFTLDVSNVGWFDSGADPRRPTLTVTFSGSAEALTERTTAQADAPLAADEIDVTFRLRDEVQSSDATGVVAITNRITGEYVLECNAEATAVIEFVRAARRYGKATDDASLYSIDLTTDDRTVTTYEKRTLLVYSEAGELLREYSLIPGGVEI
jgi:hypothetical protein